MPKSQASPEPAGSPSGPRLNTLPKYSEEEFKKEGGGFSIMTSLMPMTPNQRIEPQSAVLRFGRDRRSELQITEEINESEGEHSKM